MRIEAYETNKPILSRIDNGEYCSIESLHKKSIMYVIASDEIAIVDTKVTCRIPKEIAEELAVILEETKGWKL